MKTYGLIGKNIDYSFSRNYFNQKFKQEHILNTQYINFDIDNLNNLNKIFNTNVCGLNVTVPYKETIVPYLDVIDSHAQNIGAVNTIKIEATKKIGYNTDWIGFKNSIMPLLLPHHRKALVLGTGGASKAVVYTLEQLAIETLTVSRKGNFTYANLSDDIIKQHTIIVNCTPVGTFPHIAEAPMINYSVINHEHLAYDLIYNPNETAFLQKCKAQGAATKNGLEMLQIQADEAWKIWNS